MFNHGEEFFPLHGSSPKEWVYMYRRNLKQSCDELHPQGNDHCKCYNSQNPDPLGPIFQRMKFFLKNVQAFLRGHISSS